MPRRLLPDDGTSNRPTAWWILGLTSNPAPGNPFAASVLSLQLSAVGDGAAGSRRGVTSLLGDPAITGWTGVSGDAFRHACEPFPEQLGRLQDSYYEASEALGILFSALSGIQDDADGAYYQAHAALTSVGLADEDFGGAAGANGPGYTFEVRKVLMAKQKQNQPAVPVSDRQPGMDPGIAPDVLGGTFQQVMHTMLAAQASVLSASAAYEAAVSRCVSALEEAADASVTAVSWSGDKGGTFDQRYSLFGGDPRDLVFSGAGFDASEGAADARAWQQAKAHPDDPASVAILAAMTVTLASHKDDPDYLKGFADASPDDVAAFEGMPAADADMLNRIKLKEAVDNPAGCPSSLKKLYDMLTNMNDRDHYAPDMFLLGFDTTGNGHAAVSYGNPDTAPNTVVYVPGTTSTLGTAGGDLSRAKALYDQDPTHIASVYWLGYDAPDWPTEMGGTADDGGPANQRYADQGAPLLAGFVNALNAQHQGAQNLTLLGHSYGTTVVGDALAHHGAHAQGAIFVGSPGVTAGTAADLHLDPSRVWASKMLFDPVPSVSATLDPLKWGDDHTLRFGNDPTSSSFEGRTFASDDGSDILHAHSNYWDPDGPGLGNMAHIVTGHFDQVTGMSQDAKNGSLNVVNPLSLLGSFHQNLGHDMGSWGAPIEHLGGAEQSFGAAAGAPVGAVGDLLSGDTSGAGHELADVPGQAWTGVRDLGRSVGDLFSW